LASDRAAKIELIRTDAGKIEVVREPKATIKSITDTKINLEIIKEDKPIISAVVCGIAAMVTTTSVSTSSSSITSSSSVSISSSSSSVSVPPYLIDQSQIINNDYWFFGDLTDYMKIGQSFVPSVTKKIYMVSTQLQKLGDPTDGVVVSIYSDNTGSPGTLLQQSDNEVLSSSIPSGEGSDFTEEFDFTFSDGPELTLGNTYWIVFSRTGSQDSNNDYYIAASSTDTYLSGESKRLQITTNWENIPYPSDLYFKTYMLI